MSDSVQAHRGSVPPPPFCDGTRTVADIAVNGAVQDRLTTCNSDLFLLTKAVPPSDINPAWDGPDVRAGTRSAALRKQIFTDSHRKADSCSYPHGHLGS